MRVKRIAATAAVAAIAGAAGICMAAVDSGTASAGVTSPGAGSSTPVSTIVGATNGNSVAGANSTIGNTAGGSVGN